MSFSPLRAITSIQRLAGLAGLAVVWGCLPCSGAVIAQWTFNSQPGDSESSTGSLQANNSLLPAFIIGGVTNTFGTVASPGASDPETADDSELRLGNYPPAGTANKTAGIEFRLSTVGWKNIAMKWDQENSNTGPRYYRVQSSVDHGANWTDRNVITNAVPTNWINQTFGANFSTVPAANSNADFRVRIVAEFENTATGTGVTNYVASKTGSAYGQAGTCWYDMVTFTGDAATNISNLSVMTYNVDAEDATTWGTNDAQFQAIGHQVSYLRPDVVGFQEVTETNNNYFQMTNFIALYLPSYYLAIGPRTDGIERSVIASRFPIERAQSWLARSNLAAFGYTGVFTRNVYEAQIAVPGFSQPLHFFTTHLKAHDDEDSATRRGAEARAVSNFFVTVYLPTNSLHPYILTGDMNEDVNRPRLYEQQAIQTITSPPTGLQLTTPRNPWTGDDRTWSIQNSSLTIRFDYVLPSTVLSSNIVSSQVFRSDAVIPAVPPMLPGDSATSSDHLPVQMTFRNPFSQPFNIVSAARSNQWLTLSWQTVPGGRYRIESASVLTGSSFTPAVTNLSATGYQLSSQLAPGAERVFFRIAREN